MFYRGGNTKGERRGGMPEIFWREKEMKICKIFAVGRRALKALKV
jgi:hypothetical protein